MLLIVPYSGTDAVNPGNQGVGLSLAGNSYRPNTSTMPTPVAPPAPVTMAV